MMPKAEAPSIRAGPARWTGTALVLTATAAFGTHVADFDGDGKDDVLLWNEDAWHVLDMDGRNSLPGPTEALDLPRDTEWQVAGVGDLNGDGKDDVLFRHATGIWFQYAMDGRDTIRDQAAGPVCRVASPGSRPASAT